MHREKAKWEQHKNDMKDGFISDGIQHMDGSVLGWPAKTYLYQLCVDICYSLEDDDMPGVMVDREG